MKKILIISICVFLAGCTVNRKGEEYDMRLQKIYQQFSNLEKEFPRLPQITEDNKNILNEKLNSGIVLRINTFIEHINQPENNDKAFMYTYLNEIFNFRHRIHNIIYDPNIYRIESILPQLTSGTTSFEMKMPSDIPTYLKMGCFKLLTSSNLYTSILFATGEKEKQEIYALKHRRDGYGTNKEDLYQYGIELTGYGVKGNLIVQWYNLDEIFMDNAIVVSYCKDNNQVQYFYDNNYQGRQLPFEVIKTFSDLVKNNEWQKTMELIKFLNKYSIDPTPFWGRYAKTTNYFDIKAMNNGILSISKIWNFNERRKSNLTGLTYMFSKGQKVYLLYLDIDSEIYSGSSITSIQDFQNKYPQDYKNFIDIVNKSSYLDYERKH